MPIEVACAGCRKGLRLPDKYAGKVILCPGCKQKVKVPATAVQAVPEAAAVASKVRSEKPRPKPQAKSKPKPQAKSKPRRSTSDSDRNERRRSQSTKKSSATKKRKAVSGQTQSSRPKPKSGKPRKSRKPVPDEELWEDDFHDDWDDEWDDEYDDIPSSRSKSSRAKHGKGKSLIPAEWKAILFKYYYVLIPVAFGLLGILPFQFTGVLASLGLFGTGAIGVCMVIGSIFLMSVKLIAINPAAAISVTARWRTANLPDDHPIKVKSRKALGNGFRVAGKGVVMVGCAILFGFITSLVLGFSTAMRLESNIPTGPPAEMFPNADRPVNSGHEEFIKMMDREAEEAAAEFRRRRRERQR